MDTRLKTDAIKLRKEGYFFGEIAKELSISKSTAYLWTKQASLTESEKQNLSGRTIASSKRRIEKMTVTRKELVARKDQELIKKAKEIVSSLDDNTNQDKLMAAVMFWCEGSKSPYSGVRFTNSDPLLAAKFLKLLRSGFQIDESKMRAVLHVHEYHDVDKQILFWSKVTNIPVEQFYKPYLKPNTGIRKKIDYPGCINIRYNDNSLGKLLQFIYTEYSVSI